MKGKLLHLFTTVSMLLISLGASAQNYVSNSFDGTTFPPTGWTSSVGSGSYNWQRTTTGITYPTTTYGGLTPHSGSAMAGYNSYNASTGSYATLFTPSMNFSSYTGGTNKVSFWMWRDAYSYSGNYDSIAVYVNTSASLTGATYLGGVDRYYTLPPSVSTGNKWYQYVYTIPSSFSSSSTVYVMIKAYSAYGEDIEIDDVSVDHYAPCGSSISASIGRLSSAVCYTSPFTLSESSTTLSSGVDYQWQSAPSATGPWTNITGATSSSVTTSLISGTGYYRVLDTCAATGSNAVSNVDTVSGTPCICTPTTYYMSLGYCTSYGYSYNACYSYNITYFSVGGYSGNWMHEGTLTCPTNCTADGANGLYDRTATAGDTIIVQQGGSYNDTLKLSYPYYQNIGLWIDYNDNGAFETTECFMDTGNGCCTVSYNYYSHISIPLFAPVGYHRLRVRYCYDGTSSVPNKPTDVDPCAPVTTTGPFYLYYGPARDYIIQVVAAPTCSGAPSLSIPTKTSGCKNTPYTITATVSTTSSQGIIWQTAASASGPWTTVAGATTNIYTAIPPGVGLSYVRCIDTCRASGLYTISSVDTITTNICYCAPNYYYSPGSSPYSYYCANYGISYSACNYPSSGNVNIRGFSIWGYSGSYIRDGILACPSTCGNGYYDRTFDTVNLQQGGNYLDTVTIGSYGYYANVAIWIDYNDDGTFSNATEQVFLGGSYSTSTSSYPGTIAVSLSANPGPHRMRVRYCYDGNTAPTVPDDADPCYYKSANGNKYFYGGAVRDYVANIIQAPPCSGTPSIPVTPAGPLSLCSGKSVTLTGNYAIASGQYFQWMQSTDGGVTWTNIAGATGTNYTFTMGSTTTMLLLKDSCSNSGSIGYSNTVTINYRTVCPCTPTNYYTAGCSYNYYYFSNFQLTGATGSINQNYSTGQCNSTSNYIDYTSSVPAPTIVQGGTYSGSVTQGYTNYYVGTAIWIDYNDDGTFSSSEMVWSYGWYGAAYTQSYSFTVPSCANTGLHIMRVRNMYQCCASGTLSFYDPCANNGAGYTYYYGNSMDFLVNVTSTKTTPSLSPCCNLNYCFGNNFSITASSTSTTPTPVFKWTLPNGSVYVGATYSVSGASFAQNGIYKVQDTSGGCASSPVYDTVNMWSTPSFATGFPSSNSPVCTPGALQLYGNASPPNATIAWSGPSSYSSSVMNPVVANPTTVAGASGLSGTYTINVNNHGCTNSGSTTVQVRPTPATTGYSTTDPTTCTCNCGSITFTGLNASTSYTVNYTKNGSAVSPVSITSNASGNLTISGLNAAIYNNITFTLNGCPSTAIGPITLNNPSTPPTPVVSSNSPVCLNSNLNFTGTVSASGLTWTWTGPNSFNVTGAGTTSNPSRSNVPFSDSGNYFVYVTDALGCTSPIQTINVVIKPLPNSPTLTTNAAAGVGICSGSTLTITGATATPPGTAGTIYYSLTDPTGGTWATAPGAATLSVTNVAANLAGNWTVYSSLNGCNSATPATIYTWIKPIPGKPNPTTNSPVCAGAAYNPNLLNLNASDTTNGVNFNWTGPSSSLPGSVSGPVAGNVYTYVITNPPTTATGKYYVTASLNGCTSPKDSVSVTVNPSPVKPVVSPTYAAICQFQANPAALSATGTNLKWYFASTGGTAIPTSPVIPQDSIAGLYLYYATQTNAFGCESPAAVDSVLVKTKPSVPLVTLPPPYCQGSNIPALSAIGSNVLWYTTATGGVGSAIAPTPSSAVAGTTTYYVTQTVNGCESDRLAINVTVNPKPGKPSVVSPVQYCQGDVALPLSAGGSNLLWYLGSSGGVGSPVQPVPLTTYADTVYYYVTQTNSFGCESDRSQIAVVTNYTPNALIVANQPYVCQYDSMFFTYFGNATSSAIFNWTMPIGASILHGNSTGPIWIKFDSAGTRIVKLQVTNGKCKSPLTSYAVEVRLAPYAPTNIKDEVCQGQVLNVSLGYSNENIDKYDWNFDGANIVYGSSGSGPYGIEWNTSGLHVVRLVMYTNSCPSIPVLDSVTVHPIADAHIDQVSYGGNICAGDSISFTAERYNPAYLYQWLPANYFGTQTNSGTVYGYIEHTGYITLQVTTEFGCTSQDSTLITAQPCCEVYMPNAFTPNGDGKNDVFHFVSRGNQVLKTFRITNRWGQVVFETVNPRVGWDGKYNGVVQDMGTYFYYIEYVCANGKTYQQKGEILLIK